MLELNLHPPPVLQTERLTLHQVTADVFDDFYEIRSDERFYQFSDGFKLPTKEEVAKKVQLAVDMHKENNGISWGISLKNSSKVIGSVDYWRMMKEHYRCEIGYMLHPDYYQQGIMYEALTATIEYAFKNIKLHTIEANIAPQNIASRKLVEKCGFVQEGYFKENYFHNGRFLDTCTYSLLTPYRTQPQ